MNLTADIQSDTIRPDLCSPPASGPAVTAYDTIDYPSCTRPQTHPIRHAAIARLHGIAAASPAHCRVLEVGCGDAGNLFPLALAFPDSTFIGVDLSTAAIARGERLRDRLGLHNLHLVAADLGAGDPGPEPFDYVVAHGFYSWVPPQVRDALFALCRDRLAPAGIAYVSYNALPGCHVRRMVRDMLRFHVRGFDDPAEQLTQAQAMLQFLQRGVLGVGPVAAMLRDEVKQLIDMTDPAVLFHDDLADINDPVSITDFVAHAQRFGLRFLAEADYFEMTEDAAPEADAEQLRALAARDVVLKEQYLDFLKGRRFRQTLLCRAEAPLQREPELAAVSGFDVVGKVTCETAPVDLVEGVRVTFGGKHGAALTTDQPVAKAALAIVGETYPLPMTATELVAAARQRVGRDITGESPADRDAVLRTLFLAYRLGVVTFLCDAPRFATHAGPRPRISTLLLAQLEAGEELLASLRPSIVSVENPMTREMLRLLDGSRDRAALLSDLADVLAADSRLVPPGEAARTPEWWRDHLAPQLEAGLAQAARMALLVWD